MDKVEQAAREAAAEMVDLIDEWPENWPENARKGLHDLGVVVQAFQRAICVERERCAQIAMGFPAIQRAIRKGPAA